MITKMIEAIHVQNCYKVNIKYNKWPTSYLSCKDFLDQ